MASSASLSLVLFSRFFHGKDLRTAGGAAYCRWLQIEGSSGTGKSSLVNAGMLPMIEQGALWARTGFERWRVLGPMMPGKDPLANLATVVEHGLTPKSVQPDTLARLHRLQTDQRALALDLRDFRHAEEEKTAFLLIVDQFEELFTFAEGESCRQFGALLANALQDPECPLFLIGTVRADFLDRFGQLPCLQAIYNSHCKRYFLPTISEHGLREVIEQPARLAGVNVSEVTDAILADACGEMGGALPLVENALFTLWQQRKGTLLSGDDYRAAGGIAGMLIAQADQLLARIEAEVKVGRQAALDLLLRLTQINDEGRHSRRRISREEAVLEAGESVVQMLSGELGPDQSHHKQRGALRLIVVTSEDPRQPESAERASNDSETVGKTGEKKMSRAAQQRSVDLIHETLIRARSKDEKTGKRQGYWPTLYDYIEENRDRELHREQLRFQAEQWRQSGAFGRWWNLTGWHDLWRYRRLRIKRRSGEGRFVFWSRCAAWTQLGVLLALIGVFGEAAWWADQNKLPPSYILQKPLWLVGYAPLPEMVEIEAGSFTMGCVPRPDDVEGARCYDNDAPHRVTLSTPFALGKYEVSFREYDYYVWNQQRRGKEIEYPSDAGWGRSDRPVINVSWHDAKAYAHWLNEKTGKGYRLPTEAEWEYAAHAGTEMAYWWGNDFMKDKANCDGLRTTPVGDRYPPNPWGLHDTAGNVWEWVEDWHAPYPEDPVTDPLGPHEGRSRVLRGGSWSHFPGLCRAADRGGGAPGGRGLNIGFRVCRGAPIEPLRAAPLNTVTQKR